MMPPRNPAPRQPGLGGIAIRHVRHAEIPFQSLVRCSIGLLFPLDFGNFLDVDNKIKSGIELLRAPLEFHLPALKVAVQIDTVLHHLIGDKIVIAAPGYLPVARKPEVGG